MSRKWSMHDIEQLEKLLTEDKMTVNEIALVMGRSPVAVASKAQRLGLSVQWKKRKEGAG